MTTEAVWTSSQTSVLTVAAGLVTGGSRGQADLRAGFSAMTGTKPVLVLPDGTYRLSGRVHESGFGVTDALIEVTAGSAAGLSTSTAGGSYALYGLAGSTVLRVTRAEYEPRVEDITVVDHQTLDIELSPIRPRPDVSGTYRLSITTGSPFPGEIGGEGLSRHPDISVQSPPRSGSRALPWLPTPELE